MSKGDFEDMKPNGSAECNVIVWLEDEPSANLPLFSYLNNGGGFMVRQTESGTTAIQWLLDDELTARSRVFLADLKVPKVNPIEIATSVRRKRPEVQCVALSQHLEDPPIAVGLTKAQADGRNPFVQYWRKNDLVKERDFATFAASLRMLSQSVSYRGKVTEFEHDYGKVILTGADGKTCERIFERDILDAAGVSGPNNELFILVRRKNETPRVVLSMELWCPAGTSEEVETVDLSKYIDEHINIEEVRKILG